jgi:hypothetical protein
MMIVTASLPMNGRDVDCMTDHHADRPFNFARFKQVTSLEKPLWRWICGSLPAKTAPPACCCPRMSR